MYGIGLHTIFFIITITTNILVLKPRAHKLLIRHMYINQSIDQ